MAKAFSRKEITAAVIIAVFWMLSTLLYKNFIAILYLQAIFAINAFFMTIAAYATRKKMAATLCAVINALLTIPVIIMNPAESSLTAFLVGATILSAIVFDLSWDRVKSPYRFIPSPIVSQCSIAVFLWLAIVIMEPGKAFDSTTNYETLNFLLTLAILGFVGGLAGALFWNLIRTNRHIVRYQLDKGR